MRPPKLAALVPTRGDRPELLKRCLHYMSRQTQDHELILVDFEPTRTHVDITMRYRKGLEQARREKFDLVAFIEDDDYYHPEYLEWGVRKWEELERPNVFGIPYTYYYHIVSRRWVRLDHPGRSSAMCTFVEPRSVLNMLWPHESNPFIDLHLWHQMGGLTAVPERVLSVGIKHGIGMAGGSAHAPDWIGYDHDDKDGNFLKSLVGAEDAKFYSEFLRKNFDELQLSSGH